MGARSGTLLLVALLASCSDVCKPDDARAKCQSPQQPTEPARSSSGSGSPSSASAASGATFNLDTCADTLFSSNRDGPIDAEFGEPVDVAISGRKLAAGDVNGDDAIDLVVTTEQGVGLSLGDGEGGLAVPAPLELPLSEVWDVAVSDLDQDGAGDIVVGGLSEAAANLQVPVVVVRYGGDDTASLVSIDAQGAIVRGERVAVGDLDGDGRADIGVCMQLGTCGAAFNRGARTFAPLDVPAVDLAPFTTDLVAPDVDGDGVSELMYLALASEDSTAPFAHWRLYATADGSLQPPSTYASISAFHLPNTRALTAFDLDGDGRSELLASVPRGLIVSWPDGDDYFHSTYCLRSRVDVPSTRPDQIALGDFNADGEPDVAVTDWDRPELTLLGKRPGVQGYMLPRLVPLGLHPAGHVIAPDLDGDGYDDIVLSLPGAGVVRVFLNATQ